MTQNRLLLVGAALLLALLTAACGGGASPAPTPDPFTGLADRADQAFREGLEAYGQGSYREALDDFERARVLSPTGDPRITQMIDRTRAALEPTPTPVPPTATPVPASPTPTPASMSTETANTDLGQAYFGKVVLGVVPAKNSPPVGASQFFYQDQTGLWIEGLDKHLRLPFMLRVFDTTSSQLVAEVSSDTQDAATLTVSPTPRGTLPPTATPAIGLAGVTSAITATAAPSTPGPRDYHLTRFFDNFVWYHTGGEQPGSYRLELYANGSLTNTFDYTVGTLPTAPTPTPVEAALDPSPSLPSVPVEVPPTATPRPAPPTPRPAPTSTPLPPEPTATAQPTATPLPTATPTPATAYTTLTGGVPAGLDVDTRTGRFYIADGSGVVWTTDAPKGKQTSTLGAPFMVQPALPRDLAVDQTNGNLYIAAASGPNGGCATQAVQTAIGCVLVLDGSNGSKRGIVPLDGEPGAVRVDSDLGLLYVSVPSRQAVEVVDVRAGRVLPGRTLGDMPQVTSLGLDPQRHLLYAAHLGGQVSVIDAAAGQLLARPALTEAGLSSVAAARGQAYAINTATHELAVLDTAANTVTRYPLSQEPSAVAASEDTGAVYVLSSRASMLVRLDPTDGSELGRVTLPNRSGHVGQIPSDGVTMRPRLALDAFSNTAFASLPESGTLAAVVNDQFPELARDIPWPDDADDPVTLTADIPAVLRPAPTQFGSASAQAPGASH